VFANDVLWIIPMGTAEYGVLALILAMSHNMADQVKQMIAYQEKTAMLVLETHQEYAGKLRKHADDLEHKVDERTRELQEANEVSEQSRKELDKLNEFSREINSTTRMDEVVVRILSYITNNFGITSFWLIQVDENKREFRTERISDFLQIIPEDSLRIMNEFKAPLDPDAGLLWQVYKEKKTVFLERIGTDELTFTDFTIVELLNLKGLLLVPLVIRSRVDAVACFSNYEGELQLDSSDIARIERFCSQIAGAIFSASLRPGEDQDYRGRVYGGLRAAGPEADSRRRSMPGGHRNHPVRAFDGKHVRLPGRSVLRYPRGYSFRTGHGRRGR
jgi:hypothetical protein